MQWRGRHFSADYRDGGEGIRLIVRARGFGIHYICRGYVNLLFIYILSLFILPCKLAVCDSVAQDVIRDDACSIQTY